MLNYEQLIQVLSLKERIRKQSYLHSLQLFTAHVVFDLFTFREHKILHNRDKFPYDVAVGITFRIDKEIPVIHEVLRNYFQSRNEQKHYFLTILGNPHILIKCILLIFAFSEVATGGVRDFIKMRLQHRCFLEKLAQFLRAPISNNICSPVQYGLLVLQLINTATQRTKTSS